jgi:signal transduction histidine kinase
VKLRTLLNRQIVRASLRTELLVNIAFLAATSIVFAIGGVGMLSESVSGSRGALILSLIVLFDLAVFVAFGAIQLQRLVIKPLHEAVLAAEAIAGGDLERRMPSHGPLEVQNLAESVNRMTDRLLDERAQLVRAEKLASVGRLAAGVAHEIGNPLGAINGYAHLLRNQAIGNARAVEAVAGLERESTRIDYIVRGLLDYARPRKPTTTTIDVNDTTRSVVNLLSAQGALRDVKVVLELDHARARLVGDQHGLEQVIVNLLLNAVDALAEGAKRRNGTQGRIVIHAERAPLASLSQPAARRSPPGQQGVLHAPPGRVKAWAAQHRNADVVKIVVADSGPGVAPENTERIFDPFFTTKEPGQGTGLGLAIVARIVDNLRGTVWVVPAREGGAAFHLLFPAAP